MACLERLKTGDFFVDKQLLDPPQAVCPFCRSEIESNSHVLFTCTFSWRIWMTVLRWGGISGVLPSQCIPFIQSWRRLAPGRRRGKLWSLCLGCVVWSIWFERNKVKFEDRSPDLGLSIYALKIRIHTWAKELLGMAILPSMATANDDMLFSC